mgnify:CR=1 FL=1
MENLYVFFCLLWFAVLPLVCGATFGLRCYLWFVVLPLVCGATFAFHVKKMIYDIYIIFSRLVLFAWCFRISIIFFKTLRKFQKSLHMFIDSMREVFAFKTERSNLVDCLAAFLCPKYRYICHLLNHMLVFWGVCERRSEILVQLYAHFTVCIFWLGCAVAIRAVCF